MRSLPSTLVRAEGAAIALLGLYLYGHLDGSWLMFLLLVLLPDISIAAYAAGPSFGAVCYDVVHTYVAPSALAAIGVASGGRTLELVALIWFIHIGVDRALGFGLKYRDAAFNHTHLQRI
jgi:hypothetical protein